MIMTATTALTSDEPTLKKQKLDNGEAAAAALLKASSESSTTASRLSQFEQLNKMTTIVADTGDIEAIRKYSPQDATTNPSLIYKAATMPAYSALVDEAVTFGKGDLATVMDQLAVNFGEKITQIVPGYVSTEVDARLSFDTEATIAKALRIIDLYAQKNIPKSRILIKIAATWEGIQAAKILENEHGISCNLTLIFSKAQAIACAEANCTLISPFVGRIMDWHKKRDGVIGYAPKDDPGVKSVSEIYKYYKKFGYDTIVMGASFRNVGEVLELAGCDRLTISPNFLQELTTSTEVVEQKLQKEDIREDIAKIDMNEQTFRWMMNEDAMATEKLSEGIRNFTKDIISLEKVVESKM
jgi:transaldolase